MPRVREDRTYRVRQLPSHLDAQHLPAFLINLENSIGPLENINVHSVAGSLNTFEDVPTKTATVTFNTVPRAFDNDQTEWVFETRRLGLQKNIIFDIHFLGFTALNDVDPSIHALDCIAISGLASHPFGSWKQRDERDKKSNFMWLRDQLPQDLKQIRSILYGYDTKLLMSESFQTVEDLALSLISRLESIGRSVLSVKPLVFLAHSLGGILLKRALVEMANGNTKQNFMLDAVRMVIFFGVPNRGMRMSHLLPMVEGKPNAGLVEILSQESTFLTRLDEQFNGITHPRKIRLVSVFETARTRVPVQSVEGDWAKNGPFEILVDRESAIQYQSTDSDMLPINDDHSNLVKFPENSADYYIIAGKLREVADDFTLGRSQMSSNLGINNVERSAFDPWSFVASLSRPLAWKRKAKTATLSDPVPVNPSQSVTHRQQPKSIQTPRTDTNTTEENALIHERDKREEEKIIQKMVSSLHLNEIEDRRKEIDEKYKTTFEWVWTKTELGFISWLEEGRGGYWISGKPGSGKSTLMKHIYSRCLSKGKSLSLAQKQGHFCIGFFFHDRGSYFQKSFEGLLHSILHQILMVEPRLAKEILPIYLELKVSKGNTWQLPDLLQAFSRVLDQDTIPVDICLFMDALDEYNGPPEKIAGFIQSIIARTDKHATKVKICFSSRPWNTFIDMFSSCSGFKIHEQTMEDIQKYVTGRLGDNPSTSLLLASEDVQVTQAVTKLSLEIIEMAEGVFLWLKLIMDDLVRAHAEGASLRELSQYLSAFPKDLEDLYKNIIRRIPHEFRQESYWMLEIVLRNDGELSIPTFVDCLTCAPCETLKECVVKLKMEIQMPYTPDSIIRRLKSRCGGMIELISTSGGYKLQFMHQTVKDFISLPGFRTLITQEENLLTEENGYTLISKMLLADALYRLQILHRDQTGGELSNCIETLWEARPFLYRAEVSTGKSQRTLLDEADSAMSSYLEHDLELPNLHRPFNSIISLGVSSNLYLYVQETMQTRHVNSKPPIPLLHCAMLAACGSGLFEDVLQQSFGGMTNLLLRHGADLRVSWNGKTPFQTLLETPYIFDEVRVSRSVLPVISSMLSGGQNPDENIGIWHSHRDLVKSKALHLIDERLVQLLLQYNPDVNAVDSLGETPLDRCLEVGLENPLETTLSDHQGHIQMTLSLIKKGACITKAGQIYIGTFTNAMELLGCSRADIDFISSAPLLSMKRRILPKISKILKHRK